MAHMCSHQSARNQGFPVASCTEADRGSCAA